VDGKQVSRKLADYNDQYRTKRSVRPLADEVLDPLNQGLQFNGPMTLQQYAETVYFPNIKTKRSPSTYKGYFNLYSKQIQPRIGGLRLSTCSTADIQRILYKIDEEEELSHQSFLNINSVLSAIFTHARRSGTLQGPNPTDGVEIPEGTVDPSCQFGRPAALELLNVSMDLHQYIYVHVAHIRLWNTHSICEEMTNWRLQTIKKTVKGHF
jgi:hypothetical protein